MLIHDADVQAARTYRLATACSLLLARHIHDIDKATLTGTAECLRFTVANF